VRRAGKHSAYLALQCREADDAMLDLALHSSKKGRADSIRAIDTVRLWLC